MIQYPGMPLLQRREINVDGVIREYTLYGGLEMSAGGPYPLVILFHGAGGGPRSVRKLSGFEATAERERFLLACPRGTGRRDRILTWNAGNCCGFARTNQIDDIGFTRCLIDDIADRWNLDQNRVYAAGISNGGMLVQRLACELADRFAAVGCIAGTLALQEPPRGNPLAIIIVHGTADRHVPYDGGPSRKSLLRETVYHRSIPDTVNYWIERNRCMPSPAVTVTDSIERIVYSADGDGAAVVLLKVTGGGHTWFGTDVGMWRSGMKPVPLNTTGELTRFFSLSTNR